MEGKTKKKENKKEKKAKNSRGKKKKEKMAEQKKYDPRGQQIGRLGDANQPLVNTYKKFWQKRIIWRRGAKSEWLKRSVKILCD